MKKTLALILALAMLLAMTGCTMNAPAPAEKPDPAPAEEPAEGTDAPAPAEKQSFVVGYTPQSMEFSYFQDVVKGMQDTADASEYDVTIVVKDPQMDAAAQVTAAEELISAGAQAVIVCSVDLAAMPSLVDYVKNEKSIPLISHISPFDGADAYVSLEDYAFGKIGGDATGKYIAEQMGGNAKVAILHSKVVGENLVQRYQGYVDGIKEFAPNAEFVAEASGYEEEMAMEALETMLTENPDIDLVVATNDPGQLGAYAAIEAAGLSGKVKVCGIGSEQRVLEYIRDGKILYSVGDAAYETGIMLMDKALKLITGEAVENEEIIQCKLIDTAVAEEMLTK